MAPYASGPSRRAATIWKPYVATFMTPMATAIPAPAAQELAHAAAREPVRVRHGVEPMTRAGGWSDRHARAGRRRERRVDADASPVVPAASSAAARTPGRVLLALLLLGPALGRGFVLSYDMVWVPDLALRPGRARPRVRRCPGRCPPTRWSRSSTRCVPGDAAAEGGAARRRWSAPAPGPLRLVPATSRCRPGWSRSSLVAVEPLRGRAAGDGPLAGAGRPTPCCRGSWSLARSRPGAGPLPGVAVAARAAGLAQRQRRAGRRGRCCWPLGRPRHAPGGGSSALLAAGRGQRAVAGLGAAPRRRRRPPTPAGARASSRSRERGRCRAARRPRARRHLERRGRAGVVRGPGRLAVRRCCSWCWRRSAPAPWWSRAPAARGPSGWSSCWAVGWGLGRADAGRLPGVLGLARARTSPARGLLRDGSRLLVLCAPLLVVLRRARRRRAGPRRPGAATGPGPLRADGGGGPGRAAGDACCRTSRSASRGRLRRGRLPARVRRGAGPGRRGRRPADGDVLLLPFVQLPAAGVEPRAARCSTRSVATCGRDYVASDVLVVSGRAIARGGPAGGAGGRGARRRRPRRSGPRRLAALGVAVVVVDRAARGAGDAGRCPRWPATSLHDGPLLRVRPPRRAPRPRRSPGGAGGRRWAPRGRRTPAGCCGGRWRWPRADVGVAVFARNATAASARC